MPVGVAVGLIAAATGCAALVSAEPDTSSAGPQDSPPVQFQLQYPSAGASVSGTHAATIGLRVGSNRNT